MEEQYNKYFIETELVLNDNINIYDIRCPICHGVYQDPISCHNCMNHFCQKCHKQRQQNKCPLCNQKSETRRVFPLLRQILGGLRLKCLNNKNGCLEIIDYDSYIKHLNTCSYELEVCNLKYHQKKCPIEEIKLYIHDHRENQCNYRKVACTHCNLSLHFVDYFDHFKDCEWTPIECQKCFTKNIRKKDLFKHLQNCEQNFQKCSHCQQNILVRDLIIHETECDKRQICCVGCAKMFSLKQYFQHQNKCPKIPILCTICSAKINRDQFELHSIQQCLLTIKNTFTQELQNLKQENSILRRTVQKCKQNQQQQYRFSTKYKSQDVFVLPNKLIAFVDVRFTNKKDRFALLEQSIKDGDKWSIECVEIKSDWFAVGITEISTLYQPKKYLELGHGSYLVSANGTLYSDHDSDLNNQKKEIRISQKDIIEISYSNNKLSVINITQGQEQEFEIKQNNEIPLYGCVCLRKSGDQAKLLQ